MDILCRQEICIPADAEVKSIPLRSLPSSIRTQMGLSASDADGSRTSSDSAVGVWICPAVLRPKGQRCSSDSGHSLLKNMFSKIAKEPQASRRPLQMSFVSSNKLAYQVLNETPGAKVPADKSSTAVPPPNSLTYQVAVFVYQGRVYLSMRRPSRGKRQRETKDPAAGPKAANPATAASGERKCQAPEAKSKPAVKPPQKKRLRISVAPKRPKPPNDVKMPPKSVKLTNHVLKLQAKTFKLPNSLINRSEATTTAQERLNTSKPEEKPSKIKEMPGKSKQKDSCITPKDASSSTSPPTVLQTPDQELKPETPRPAEAAEEPVDWLHQENNEEPGREDALISSQDDNVDNNLQTYTPTWSSSRAYPGSPSQQECDFAELQREEMIARLKAKVQLNKDALKNHTP